MKLETAIEEARKTARRGDTAYYVYRYKSGYEVSYLHNNGMPKTAAHGVAAIVLPDGRVFEPRQEDE